MKDTVAVRFEDFVFLLSKLRQTIESDVSGLIRKTILPAEALDDDPYESGDVYKSGNKTKGNKSNSAMSQKVQRFLSMIWDVVESPFFAASFTEGVDTCFRYHITTLRDEFFNRNSNVGDDEYSRYALSTPPLATLLPQLKSVASRMLPADQIGEEVRRMLQGPTLDTFCVSLLLAPADDYDDLQRSDSDVDDRSRSPASEGTYSDNGNTHETEETVNIYYEQLDVQSELGI